MKDLYMILITILSLITMLVIFVLTIPVMPFVWINEWLNGELESLTSE
jgi:hypothetical protein